MRHSVCCLCQASDCWNFIGRTSISVFETSVGAGGDTFVATDTFEMKRLLVSVPQEFDFGDGLARTSVHTLPASRAVFG